MGNNAGLFSRFKNIIIPSSAPTEVKYVAGEITNNAILRELIECFQISCTKESVGGSLLFNTHFIIVLHPNVYEERLASLPAVVKEAVKAFYQHLKQLQPRYEEIIPVSATWHFKFGPGAAFNNEQIKPTDIKVIGMLTGPKDASLQPRSSATAKVTMKSKLTNVFDRMDINLDAFYHIDFKESGTFAVKFNPLLEYGGPTPQPSQTQVYQAPNHALAQIDYYLADQHKEETYLMKDNEIVVARKEPDNLGYSNYLLVDSPYISNPHVRIRYNDGLQRFQLASFSRNETRLNEQVIPKSDFTNPQWTDLAPQSQILLNSMVTLQFKSNK
jgi:hypothetical protein